MALNVGDAAPEWTLMGARGDAVAEVSLKALLEDSHALVLHTYPLDFTGG